MLSELSPMSVKQQILCGTLKLTYKIKNRMVPKYGATTTNNSTHDHNLRNGSDFRLNRCIKSNTKSIIIVYSCGLKQFNELPPELKSEFNFNSFVNRLKVSVKRRINVILFEFELSNELL